MEIYPAQMMKVPKGIVPTAIVNTEGKIRRESRLNRKQRIDKNKNTRCIHRVLCLT
jgi:hypothetical protein